jgi:hypothetical protein
MRPEGLVLSFAIFTPISFLELSFAVWISQSIHLLLLVFSPTMQSKRLIVPTLILLGLNEILDKTVLATLFGGLMGYILSGPEAKDD